MSREVTERIKDSPKFQELVKVRARFGWQMSAIILVIYYGFIMVIAFAPQLLGTPVFPGSVITIGIPVGVLVIISAIVLTGVYVSRANREFDTKIKEIIEETK